MLFISMRLVVIDITQRAENRIVSSSELVLAIADSMADGRNDITIESIKHTERYIKMKYENIPLNDTVLSQGFLAIRMTSPVPARMIVITRKNRILALTTCYCITYHL